MRTFDSLHRGIGCRCVSEIDVSQHFSKCRGELRFRVRDLPEGFPNVERHAFEQWQHVCRPRIGDERASCTHRDRFGPRAVDSETLNDIERLVEQLSAIVKLDEADVQLKCCCAQRFYSRADRDAEYEGDADDVQERDREQRQKERPETQRRAGVRLNGPVL